MPICGTTILNNPYSDLIFVELTLLDECDNLRILHMLTGKGIKFKTFQFMEYVMRYLGFFLRKSC